MTTHESVEVAPDRLKVVTELPTINNDHLQSLLSQASSESSFIKMAKVTGLDVDSKLKAVSHKLQKGLNLSKEIHSIYVVVHAGVKLVDILGRDVPLSHLQDALWVCADGPASLSKAKIALLKYYDIESKGWHGYYHPDAELELIKLELISK